MSKMPIPVVAIPVFIMVVGFLFFVSQIDSSIPITVPHVVDAPMDNLKLLKAIAMTENWDGESVGAAGERGPWQMLPSTWKQYTKERFPTTRRQWEGGFTAQCVIRDHASWIRDVMDKHKLEQNPYTFALIWKAGYGHVLANTLHPADVAYAERAGNNYKELP